MELTLTLWEPLASGAEVRKKAETERHGALQCESGLCYHLWIYELTLVKGRTWCLWLNRKIWSAQWTRSVFCSISWNNSYNSFKLFILNSFNFISMASEVPSGKKLNCCCYQRATQTHSKCNIAHRSERASSSFSSLVPQVLSHSNLWQAAQQIHWLLYLHCAYGSTMAMTLKQVPFGCAWL